jgi:hypothetical protein
MIRSAAIVSTVVLVFLSANRSFAQDLRYDWQSAQVFAYEITITVDLPDAVETFRGLTTYRVDSVDGDNRNVTYQGGLIKDSKKKDTGRRQGFDPFGGGGGGFGGGPASPFARNNFRGTEQTTNSITLSPYGGFQRMEGDSQIPYLVGNISLLPFEPLPNPPAKQWQTGGNVAITEKEERSERFSPFDPFGRPAKELVQAASEIATYSVIGQQGDIVSIAKTMELKSPPANSSEVGFTLTGRGTWKFNRALKVPESLDFNEQFVVQAQNTQITVPIKIAYRRLSDSDLAKLTAARQAATDAARRQAEEMQVARVAAQQQAEAPLTTAEKQSALAALRSGNPQVTAQALTELQKKSPKDEDADVISAMQPLLQHKDQPIRAAAHSALVKWSSSYRPRGDLDKAYSGRGSMEPSGRAVTSSTPLYVGQILQAKDSTVWRAAEVLDIRADGAVKITYRTWGSTWDTYLTRDKLQLAPDELFQPAKSPSMSAVASPVASTSTHTWSDATGKFRVEAVYLGVADGKVLLKRTDGKELAVPLEKLSEPDRQHVNQLQAAQDKNPFE